MSVNGKAVDVPDLTLYIQNRPHFPEAELQKYADQHVAFSLDGTRIVAAAADVPDLYKRLEAAGIPPGSVVLSYVVPSDVALL